MTQHEPEHLVARKEAIRNLGKQAGIKHIIKQAGEEQVGQFRTILQQKGPYNGDENLLNRTVANYALEQATKNLLGTEDSAERIYGLAKRLFRVYDGQHTFDLTSTLTGSGSSYVHDCSSPEEWMICTIHMVLRGVMKPGDSVGEVAAGATFLIGRMICLFGDARMLKSNLDYICQNNDELAGEVRTLMGW